MDKWKTIYTSGFQVTKKASSYYQTKFSSSLPKQEWNEREGEFSCDSSLHIQLLTTRISYVLDPHLHNLLVSNFQPVLFDDLQLIQAFQNEHTWYKFKQVVIGHWISDTIPHKKREAHIHAYTWHKVKQVVISHIRLPKLLTTQLRVN